MNTNTAVELFSSREVQ